MPNPKFGTVTLELAKMVGIIKSGQVKFKSDRYGIVHVKIGDIGFTPEDLLENFNAVVAAVQGLRPTTIKGSYVRGVFVNSTMGRSFRIAGIG